MKQSGDAWRIVLDCCLPVLHLIDTRRSIPYAIKQLQELLGISCAFDQAVQVPSLSLFFPLPMNFMCSHIGFQQTVNNRLLPYVLLAPRALHILYCP